MTLTAQIPRKPTGEGGPHIGGVVVGLATGGGGLVVVLGGRQLGRAQNDVLQLSQEPLRAPQHRSKGREKWAREVHEHNNMNVIDCQVKAS